jgi:hypothetical protein
MAISFLIASLFPLLFPFLSPAVTSSLFCCYLSTLYFFFTPSLDLQLFNVVGLISFVITTKMFKNEKYFSSQGSPIYISNCGLSH